MLAFKSEEQSQLLLVEREEIDDEEDLFEAIEKLTTHGINAGDVKKLQDDGIHTCNGLMMHTKKNLTGIKGLSETKVEKICEAAEKIVNFGYITGSDALLKRKSVVRITTWSQALDELLGGGIDTLAITEAFGEFRSGKTQLAHTLCVSTQLAINMKGGNGKVAYIDTEGTFHPDRIVAIAERFGMDPVAVLDNIIYAHAIAKDHQYNLFMGLAAKLAEEPFHLLIVGSVIALFRVDFTGRGELAERQEKLAQMLSRVLKITEDFNVDVNMQVDPRGGVFISDPEKPATKETGIGDGHGTSLIGIRCKKWIILVCDGRLVRDEEDGSCTVLSDKVQKMCKIVDQIFVMGTGIQKDFVDMANLVGAECDADPPSSIEKIAKKLEDKAFNSFGATTNLIVGGRDKDLGLYHIQVDDNGHDILEIKEDDYCMESSADDEVVRSAGVDRSAGSEFLDVIKSGQRKKIRNFTKKIFSAIADKDKYTNGVLSCMSIPMEGDPIFEQAKPRKSSKGGYCKWKLKEYKAPQV